MDEVKEKGNGFHEVSGIVRLALILLGLIVRSWQATLRYQCDPNLEGIFRDNPEGSLVLLWHNRLFPGIGALRNIDQRGQTLFALVSPSKDGAQLSHFLRSIGLRPIRGSSSRRGGVALRELLKVIANGDHVAITVDGPRGPCYAAQPGAAMLIQQTGAPVNFLGVECESCWQLNSWDKFIIPKPFSRIRIKMDRYAHSPRLTGKEERKAIQEVVQERLDRLTEDRHRQAP